MTAGSLIVDLYGFQGSGVPVVQKEVVDWQMKKKYIYWQDDDMWLGYLKKYPDYWTQGETEEELRDNLLDIYSELTSGTSPNVRKVAELEV